MCACKCVRTLIHSYVCNRLFLFAPFQRLESFIQICIRLLLRCKILIFFSNEWLYVSFRNKCMNWIQNFWMLSLGKTASNKLNPKFIVTSNFKYTISIYHLPFYWILFFCQKFKNSFLPSIWPPIKLINQVRQWDTALFRNSTINANTHIKEKQEILL